MQTNWQINWQTTGASIIGSAHVRKGLPNQDAYGEKNLDGGIQVLALSDGHGGERHPYSDFGSKAAVEAAIECVEAYVTSNRRADANRLTIDASKLQYDFEGQLSVDIQKKWLEKVKTSNVYESSIQFGCTLLLAVKFEDILVMLQLGDGKIAVVYTDGIIYYPMPRDLRYENNETASMAQTHAWSEMKVVAMQMEENIHTIVLASDGVENAYPQDYYDDAFFYMALAVSDSKAETLLQMLNKASQFSKDDTTAVMCYTSENTMPEAEVPESLTIWMGDYPNGWIPIACHLEATIDKRIDLGILLIDAICRKDGYVSQYLTLKQIYRDSETSQLEYFVDGNRELIDTRLLYSLITQLLILPETAAFMKFDEALEIICLKDEPIKDVMRNIKKQLISMKRHLRYDYQTQAFVCDDKISVVSLSGSNGNFALFYESDVYLHQLMSLVGDYDVRIGKVRQHAKYKSVWGLVNLTQHTWQVVGGKQKAIEPGMTMTLQDAITVFIHGIPVKIRILNQ